MKVNINTPLTEITRNEFNHLKDVYKYNLKISDFIPYVKLVTGLDFDSINYNDWTAEFYSYLLDLLDKFKKGEDIDLTELHQDVINVLHPSKIEQQRLVQMNVEERLWAILKSVSDPYSEKI